MQEVVNLIPTLITAVVSVLGGNWIGVVSERRKTKAEAKNIEADFNDKMQKAYTKFIQDAQDKYDELLKENELLKEKIKELSSKIEELTEVINKRGLRINQ